MKCSPLQAVAVAAAAFTMLYSARVSAQTATTPGAITTPYPTTQGVSIEWAISGDSNANGVVAVRYRPSGGAWKIGMPLRRIPAGTNTSGSFGSGNGQWSNKHAGSLFDLAAGQLYDIELTLTDPDGGSMTTMTSVGTRAIPVASANAVMKAVTPSTFSSALSAAMPGDVLLLGAGSYPAFTVSRSGAAGQPIVIRGESVDTVTIGGRVTMSDRQYVHLENVTVMGEVRLNGASNMVVRGCRVRTTSNGITFQIGNAVPRNNFIVDNDVTGGATWVDDQLSVDGYDGGEGIEFTGSGHVICFNHVARFRDDISFMEYEEAFEQVSIDICNNDIEEATDDAIEADSAMGNVRVFRNRIRNCFQGISAQPNLGGPTYYVRNAEYNVLYSPFKFHNGSVGDVVLHNTVVKCGDGLGIYAGNTWSQAMFRNNVFIGGMGGGTYGGYSNGSGRPFQLADADATCSFDYDGVAAVGISSFSGRIGGTSFSSFATLTANTSEKHAVMVDMSIFANAPAFPSNPYPPHPVADLRISAANAAIDKGLAIPGINDDFAGSAPDLGAYEAGASPPTYGPRVGGVVTGTGGVSGTGGTGATGSGGTGGSAATGRGGATGSGTGGSTGATGAAGTGSGVGTGGAGGSTIPPPSPPAGAGAGGVGSGPSVPGETSREVVGGCACASAAPPGGQWFGMAAMAAAIASVVARRRDRRGGSR